MIVRTTNRGLIIYWRRNKANKGNIIIGMDADGNHDPEDMPNILKHLTGDIKLVVASRF